METPQNPPGILLSPQPIGSLAAYIESGGFEGFFNAKKKSPNEILNEIKISGLKGRGGAAFPTHVKWKAVLEETGPMKFIVCNAAEGEPGTLKDRYLILSNPYQLLEGLLIAALVLNPRNIFIGIKSCFKGPIARLEQALAEMLKEKIIEPGFITIVKGPDSYLLGEEKALMTIVSGITDYASPGLLAPYIQGLMESPDSHHPTLVNNVETFATIPHILKHGGRWYKTIGSPKRPGTILVTLSGDIVRPGVYEMTGDMGLKDLFEGIGGGGDGGRTIKAVFPGLGSRVITQALIGSNIRLDDLADHGVTSGSFGFMVYGSQRSMVAAAERFARFFASQLCGQCIPCYTGLQVIRNHLGMFLNGTGTSEDMSALIRQCRNITSQARCHLPTAASILIPGIIDVFPDEFLGQPVRDKTLPIFPVLDSL